MARPYRGPRTRMTRISIELDNCLSDLASQLAHEMRKPVTKTEASRVMAATQNREPKIIMNKGRVKLMVKGSLISL